MDSWFAVEEIDNDTFAISEYRHWEETHCYLLLGTESAILIDTGLGISNIRNIVDHLTLTIRMFLRFQLMNRIIVDCGRIILIISLYMKRKRTGCRFVFQFRSKW